MKFEIGMNVTARQAGKDVPGTITGRHGNAEYYAVRLETGETIYQYGNDLEQRETHTATQYSTEQATEKKEAKNMYDYMKAIKDDVKQAICDNYDLTEWEGRRDELEETLNDDLWIDDSVTGNGSGSYTFSREQAREYVQADGLQYLRDMCAEFGITAADIGEKFIDDNWEWIDVSIRCYLLGQAIYAALDELEEEQESAE